MIVHRFCSAIISLFAICLLTQSAFAQTGEISGTVINKTTQSPVPGATITVVDTKLGGVSKPDGTFTIKNVPVGTYQLKVTSIGYEPRIYTDVIVATVHTNNFTIDMTERSIELQSVSVEASTYEKSSDNITSVNKFNYEEVRRQPGAAEDISRMVQALPGVAFANDMRNDLIVRGGSPVENLTILDGIEIPNINHFGTQGAGGGAIGMVDANLIEDITFSSGGFGAGYGDKLSSVLDIRMRDGSRDQFQGNINLSTAGLGGVIEGPIGDNGSYIASVRRSYLNLIHNLIGLSVIPNYQDAQFKVNYDLSPQNKLTLIGLGSYDLISFGASDSNSNGLQYQNTQNNQWQFTSGLLWKSLWNDKGYSTVSLSTNQTNYFINVDDTNQVQQFHNESTESEYTLDARATYQLDPVFTLSGGASAKLVHFRDAIYQRTDSTPYRDSTGALRYIPYGYNVDAPVTTDKLAVFTELSANISPSLILRGGLRFDHFAYLTSQTPVISPRAGISYFITPVTSLNFSYGMYRQPPEYIWFTTAPENRNLSYIRCDHYILGFEHQFDADLKFTIEAYDKEYSNYPVSTANPYYIFVNAGADYGAFIAPPAQSTGTGYVRGIDVFLQKKLIEGLYGTVDYSYSKSSFVAGAGGARPGAFDYENIFTITAGYVFSKYMELSAKFRYDGGRPYTPFNDSLSVALNQGVLDYTQYNTLRYPAYSRLDIRFDYRWFYSWGNIVSYIELQNVFNRVNIAQYYWNTRTLAQGQINEWSFVPVGGFKLEF